MKFRAQSPAAARSRDVVVNVVYPLVNNRLVSCLMSTQLVSELCVFHVSCNTSLHFNQLDVYTDTDISPTFPKLSLRMVRADPDPDVHDQLRVHGDAAGAVLDHAGGALRGVPGPGDRQLVMVRCH